MKKTEYQDADIRLQAEITNRWSDKKSNNQILAHVYYTLQDDLGFSDQKIRRVDNCGSYLEFHSTNDGYKLKTANFCRDRLCPMCQWRRSLKMFSQVSSMMDYISLNPEYDGIKFAFLTLTIKNCDDDHLTETINTLLSGYKKLTNKSMLFRNKIIVGSFRSLEVKRSINGKAWHPHLHVILALSPEYFKRDKNRQYIYYLSQKEWSNLWSSCAGLEYKPVIDIRMIKSYDPDKNVKINLEKLHAAVAEAAKYSVKGSDFLFPYDLAESEKLVKILSSALAGRRLFGFTGIFNDIRKILALDDPETGDLVHVDDESINIEIEKQIVIYQWKAGAYVRQ